MKQPFNRTPTAAEIRRAAALVAEALSLLEPKQCSLLPGDVELAEVLLPAWWSTVGNRSATIGDLRQQPPGTRLAAVLAQMDDRMCGNKYRASQQLGFLCGRLADSGQAVAGYYVAREGVAGNVQVWACRPLETP